MSVVAALLLATADCVNNSMPAVTAFFNSFFPHPSLVSVSVCLDTCTVATEYRHVDGDGREWRIGGEPGDAESAPACLPFE